MGTTDDRSYVTGPGHDSSDAVAEQSVPRGFQYLSERFTRIRVVEMPQDIRLESHLFQAYPSLSLPSFSSLLNKVKSQVLPHERCSFLPPHSALNKKAPRAILSCLSLDGPEGSGRFFGKEAYAAKRKR